MEDTLINLIIILLVLCTQDKAAVLFISVVLGLSPTFQAINIHLTFSLKLGVKLSLTTLQEEICKVTPVHQVTCQVLMIFYSALSSFVMT